MKPRKNLPAAKSSARKTTARPRAVSARRSRLVPALVLLALVLLAYLPALQAGWIWDDDQYVTGNHYLNDFHGLGQIWTNPAASPQYYPVVFTTFWLEHHLWGLRPAGYHLANVLLHGANAFLLWILLEQLAVPGALFAAALFAVHPVEVESVAWVTERKNVLSGLFCLLSLLAYLRFRAARAGLAGGRGEPARAGSGDAGESEPVSGGGLTRPANAGQELTAAVPGGAGRIYATSLALFAVAMSSKTVAASLPVAILLLIWWKEGRIRRRDLAWLLPFFALALGGGLVTALLEKFQVGATGREWSLGPVQRFLLAGRSLWFYVGKTIWPAHLSFTYPRWSINAGVWWQWLFTPAALAALYLLWRRRESIGRGPVAGALVVAAALMPALGFFDVYAFRFSYVADHFQYHASLGLMALTAAAATLAAGRLRLPRLGSRFAAGAIVAALAFLTMAQTRMYQDTETLWRRTIETDPSAWMATNNLAALLNDRGKPAEALGLLNRSLALYPDHPEALYNRGNSYLASARLDRAVADYDRALRLRPDYAEAFHNRGNAYARMGRTADAIREISRALELQPRLLGASYNRGNAYAATGEFEPAIRDYTREIELQPGFAEAYYGRGNAFLATNRPQPALADFSRALQLRPSFPEACFDRALCLAATGRAEEALRDFSRAIELQPKNPPAYCSRGRLQANLGHYPEALADLDRAIEQQPDFSDAYLLRAACRCQTKDYDGAWEDVRAVRRLGGTVPADLLGRLSKASGRGE